MCMSFCLRRTGNVLGILKRTVIRLGLILPGKRKFFSTVGACKADSLSSVRDLMLVEEFKNCVPERTVVYLKEQKLTTLQHAATLADEFI